MESTLAPPSRDQAAALVASEIRAHFKGLKGSERLRLAHKAIDAKDRVTLTALLHAPAYLSGLMAEEHATPRQTAAAALTPAAVELERVDAVLDTVRLAGKTLDDRYGEILARLKRPEDDRRAATVRTLARG